MASSKFTRMFFANGTPLLGAAIWLVPQANVYPDNALALTEDTEKAGQYYRDNVPDGEYKIYIDAEGGTSPSLWDSEIYIAEKRLTLIADHFDAGDSYRLKTEGIKDRAVTLIKLNLDEHLLIWTNSLAFEVVSATYNAEGVATSASVKWPDGSEGVFTATTINTVFNAIDAYTITHADSSKTVTQSAVTRDINGNITTKPEISIA